MSVISRGKLTSTGELKELYSKDEAEKPMGSNKVSNRHIDMAISEK